MNDALRNTIISTVVGCLITAAVTFTIHLIDKKSEEEKIVETWSGYFTTVTKEMGIEEAIKAVYGENDNLREQNSKYESEIKTLHNDLDAINSENDEYRISLAQNYATNQEFDKALNQLSLVLNQSPDIEFLKSEYSKQFEQYIISQVDNLVTRKNFDEADSIVRTALKTLPNSVILQQQLTLIEKSKPVKLSKIGVGDYNNCKQYTDDSITDTAGKKHSGPDVFTINAKGDPGCIRFYLGGEYNRITGGISISENSPNGQALAGNIEIKTDGETVQAYDVPNRAITPISFDLDITGTDWFEIKYNGSYFSLANGNESFEIVIYDINLYRQVINAY